MYLNNVLFRWDTKDMVGMQDSGEMLHQKDKIIAKTSNCDGRYQTLFEQVNAAALLTTFEGEIVEVNQKSCELFGYGWNEILRLSLRDLLPKETDWEQFIDEIAAKGGLHFETESIIKDGSYVPTEISISLFKMDGKPVMFVLVWDITEKKKSEDKLRESEKKYRGLFEYTTDGTLVLDARGDIREVNTKICEILDVSKNDLIGKNLFHMDLLTATSSPVVIHQFEQLLSEKTAHTYTTEIKNKQGKVLNVEVSSFFLVKQDNEVDNFVLIIHDITSRNAQQRKRIHEHGLLKTLVDNIPDSIYFKDEQNRFILVNKAKAEHSMISPEEMIGKTDFDFLPHEQAQKIVDDDKNIMQSGQPIVNKEEKITNNDGSERWLSVTKIPWFNAEGDIIGIMGISRDITDMKISQP
jgi:PAS domain S-box-containing protein